MGKMNTPEENRQILESMEKNMEVSMDMSKTMSKMLHARYEHLIKAGFTENQSMEIVKARGIT